MKLQRRAFALLLSAAACGAGPVPASAAGGAIRVGTLRFGSLAWEMDVLRRHGLDRDLQLQPIEFAAGPASQVALQAGSVDVVLQDWLWVSRQRASGADWTCAPVPAPLGAVMRAENAAIGGVAELRGKRLGIAGGPLDKSWLLLRLFARRNEIDLDAAVEKTFGPPPLIAEQLRAGRLDAELTYWPFAARGQAAGLKPILTMADVLAGLDLPRDMPMLGFVFSQDWASRNQPALHAFLTAMQQARSVLAGSDAEWQQIAPLTGARNDAELAALRDWYRQGFPGTWDDTKQRAASRLFDLFASVGGADLVGSSRHLAPGTFWPID